MNDRKTPVGYIKVSGKGTNAEALEKYKFLMGVPAETSAMAYHVAQHNKYKQEIMNEKRLMYKVTTDKKSWDYIKVLTWHEEFEVVKTENGTNFTGYLVTIPRYRHDKLMELKDCYSWIINIEPIDNTVENIIKYSTVN